MREAETSLLAAMAVHELELQREIEEELRDSPHRIRPRLLTALRESRARERAVLERLGGTRRPDSE